MTRRATKYYLSLPPLCRISISRTRRKALFTKDDYAHFSHLDTGFHMVNKTGDINAAIDQPVARVDRRKHQRAQLPLKARFLNEVGQEHRCIVVDVSAGGAFIRTKNPPAFGKRVVLYIEQLGRYEGLVTRSDKNCFAIHYEKGRKKSAETADKITEVLHKGRRSTDRRKDVRTSHDKPTLVHFEDGRSEECAILDISLTGASIEVSPRPPLGMRLILGRMTAKVIRRHDTGVGVLFTGSADKTEPADSDLRKAELPHRNGTKIAPPFGTKGANA